MRFIITGRKLDVTDGLRDRIHKKLGKLDKFFDADTEVHVTLEVEKDRQIVEVTIPFNGMILRAEEANSDMYASIDKIVDTLERQIRKNKTRLAKKLKENAFVVETVNDGLPPNDFEEETEFNIVKTKRFAIKPMDIEEAILQMNLLGHQFFVFSNADTEEVNVVYRRKDGNYGLIEPEF
ncbi:MAG: putative sigma-54 modulation protein [Petroclostridium sp.]|jgi:putative sigma-54 modulation protein|uniref:ribosome hibernation-promoting factor, HPF/YfiA family n=1 Tax=Petroclostridium xylanilyticum TaxID=1792311 RepID=UPI000B97EDB8|nr:ribosome-associated translation inhibitor RaiA [Petroclostridium xylanilyticum]MBZ4646197.1 raiA [Clostridia bacterium]MDK2810398.1 putative sigma-54 modulation protein [Petroclostridium sp.]